MEYDTLHALDSETLLASEAAHVNQVAITISPEMLDLMHALAHRLQTPCLSVTALTPNAVSSEAFAKAILTGGAENTKG
jgi:hypothetical protein